MIKLEKDKILVLRNGITREELIRDMKNYGITVKCFSVSRRPKKSGVVGPALDIRFVTAESGRASFIHGKKSKERAIELLGLKTKEDCERINRELED